LLPSAVVLAASLAACGDATGTVLSTTLTTEAVNVPLPVTLRDETGIVVAIEQAQVEPVDFRNAGVLADPVDPTAFVLTWLGGMCDADAAITFRHLTDGYNVHLEIHPKGLFGACPAAGVLRALRIQTSKALDATAISIGGSRTIELITDEDCGPLRDAETGDAKIACFALLEATTGERPETFARVTVRPDGGACAGTDCATNAGIAARAWRVEATDRSGGAYVWRCTYRAEQATCVAVVEPSPT